MTEQMKPSGVTWIGDIPSTWTVKRIKYVIHSIKDGTHGTFDRVENGKPLLSAKNVFDDGIRISEIESEISDKDYNLITANGYPRKNDVLMCCVGTVGRTCVYEFPYSMAFQRSVSFLRPNSFTNSRFLKYCLQSDSTLSQEQLLINKSAQDGLYMGAVRELIIPFSQNLFEQQAIADYLDSQCAKIDSIAADLEKQIELLQKYKKSLITETVTKGLDKTVSMKDSGIEWFGKVPEHWETSKIKYCFSVVNGSTPDSNDFDNWDGDIHWITPADMNETGFIDHGERDITMKGYNSCGTTMLPKGSIIISTRAPIGKINISKSKLCTNQGCKSLIKTADNRYHYYLLLACQEQLIRFGRGTTFLELSSNDLKNMDIIIPSEKEQTIISDFLDKKCESIDNIISNKQAQLNTITQHKKSLIYDYVTGKKRVKEAQ